MLALQTRCRFLRSLGNCICIFSIIKIIFETILTSETDFIWFYRYRNIIRWRFWFSIHDQLQTVTNPNITLSRKCTQIQQVEEYLLNHFEGSFKNILSSSKSFDLEIRQNEQFVMGKHANASVSELSNSLTLLN